MTDSPEVQKSKIDTLKKRRSELESAKSNKFDDIVATLDMFDGQLSLNDIMNQDIPVINALRDAKIRRNNEIMKAREKQLRESASGKKSK